MDASTTAPTVTAVRRLLLVLFAVTMAATACGGGGADDGLATGTGSGGSLPDFGGTTVDGRQLVSADYAGQDVILWFWAPW